MKNWEQFQHYKDRNPAWIKLYPRLIDGDDLAYGNLPDHLKIQLIHLWLLASRHDNKVPFDQKWLTRRLNVNNKPDVEALVKAGFVEVYEEDALLDPDASSVLAHGYQDDTRSSLLSSVSSNSCNSSNGSNGCNSQESAFDADAAFEEVWAAYPRKLGRQGALKHFRATVKTLGDVPRITEALRRFKEELRVNQTLPKYIPHGDTWFNKWQEYEDYTPPMLLVKSADPDDSFIDWDAIAGLK